MKNFNDIAALRSVLLEVYATSLPSPNNALRVWRVSSNNTSISRKRMLRFTRPSC
jgi:hypothetical protein